MMKQPEFDFSEEPLIGESSTVLTCRPNGLVGSTPASSVILDWDEVPQARFLSWSKPMQLSYCAARDLNSAESAHLRGEDPEFYLKRAEQYAIEALEMKATHAS